MTGEDRAEGHEFTLEESLPECRRTAPGEMSTPQAIARTILEGFEKRWAQFRAQSVAAKEAFETADRARAHELSRMGIDTYDQRVWEAVESVLRLYPEARTDETLWPQVKQVLIGLLYDHKRPECAETFYNSVACRVLDRTYYRNEYIFWRQAVATEFIEADDVDLAVLVPGRREPPHHLPGDRPRASGCRCRSRTCAAICRKIADRLPRAPARACGSGN